MSETSKVSIIIPCYNVAKYVTRCIESILGQNYDNIEIIAVNDASSDNTSEVFSKMRNAMSFGGVNV